MVRDQGLSRRACAALLIRGGALAAVWGRDAVAQEATGADRGLGGTGAVPVDPAETLGQDRGIGGTGVIGTIRRFGSIVVNDLKVTFPADVKVAIDGRAAALNDLRVGHVVRVLARQGLDGVLTTRAIVANSEVVGPVEAHEGGVLVVLGQRIVLGEGVMLPAHRAGAFVAVSGLRRIDGSVVASLVERRPEGAARLHGPVAAGPGGAPVIGGTRIPGLAAALLGRRVSLVGTRDAEGFRATHVTVEPAIPFAAAERLSVEAYVARAPDGLRLGQGLDIAASPATLAAIVDAEAMGAEAVRAVVTARPGSLGRLNAQSLRLEHEAHAAAGRSGTPGTRGGPEGPRGGSPRGGNGPGGPVR